MLRHPKIHNRLHCLLSRLPGELVFAPPAHRSALHHGSEVYCCNTSHSRFFPIPQLTRESPFRTPPPDGHNEESYAILLHLNSKWPTSRSMKELLRLMKNKVKGKILWCEKYQGIESISTILWGRLTGSGFNAACVNMHYRNQKLVITSHY